MNLSDAVTAFFVSLSIPVSLYAAGLLPRHRDTDPEERPEETPGEAGMKPATTRPQSCPNCPHEPHGSQGCEHVTTDGPVRTSCGCDAGVGLQEEMH